jgi:hypothetical protein
VEEAAVVAAEAVVVDEAVVAGVAVNRPADAVDEAGAVLSMDNSPLSETGAGSSRHIADPWPSM